MPGADTPEYDSILPKPKDGIFPHRCEHAMCEKMVEFDDEPWCFTHSPDSGSSIRGYSAYSKYLMERELRKDIPDIEPF